MTTQPPAGASPSSPSWGSGAYPPGQQGPHQPGTYGPSYGAGPPYAPVQTGGYGPYGSAAVGRVRGTGVCILLTVVTFGIYPLIWYYQTHEEMRRHTGQGIGGLVALLLAMFVGVASPFLTSHEVGEMYARAGRPQRVTALTGLWFIPGFLILVGPVVWFVQTNAALNDYWRSLGAR